MGGTEDNLLCYVYTAGAVWTSVEGADIVGAVRAASKAQNFHNRGNDPDMIGAHSLRAGDVMALKIMGYSDSTIQKFGCWTSDTWQMYIHIQILKLYEGRVDLTQFLRHITYIMINSRCTTSCILTISN